MKVRFFALILALSGFNAVKAQIEVKLELQPKCDTILLGDQLSLNVSVIAPANGIIVFPEFKDGKIGEGLETLHIGDIDTVKTKDTGRVHLERQYLITSFTPAIYTLDRFPVLWLSPTRTDTAYSFEPLTLVVKYVDIDKDFKPYDIKDIRTYSTPWWVPALWVTGCLLAAALLALGIFTAIRKYRKKQQEEYMKINPFEWATGELQRVKESGVAVLHPKEYYSQLTDIVRKYIELVTDVSVMEKTSDEILSLVPETALNSHELLGRLNSLFSVADLVKFAKYQATTSESETSWSDAIGFVIQSNDKITAMNAIVENAKDNDLKQQETENDKNSKTDSELS